MSSVLRLSSFVPALRLATLPRSSRPLVQRALHSSCPLFLDTERPSPSSSSFPPPNLSPAARRRPPPAAAPTPVPPQPAPTPPPVEARVPRRRITSVDQLPPKFGRNQIIPIPREVQKELNDILSTFKAPVRYAFAYGSGVFRQAGYDAEDKPLLDFIFAVSHPSHWHAVNMQQHPEHYSPLMRLLGSDAVAWMQENGLGADVWFNIGVEVNGSILKYGVISIEALCRDMLDWETLYISGRTQKPVKILHDDARVRLSNQVNLASAMRTSLLLLPESFTERELFETIAGLSYRGDFRMAVGENPQKVQNIVSGQFDAFRSLYGGLLKSFWKSVYVIGESPSHELGGRNVKLMRQDVSVQHRATVASKLPVGVRDRLRAYYERKWNLRRALGNAPPAEGGAVPGESQEQELWERIVRDDEFTVMLDKSIGQIVARPTFNQSLKGILSAGPVRSLRYIGPKLRKKWWPKKTHALPPPPPSSPSA